MAAHNVLKRNDCLVARIAVTDGPSLFITDSVSADAEFDCSVARVAAVTDGPSLNYGLGECRR